MTTRSRQPRIQSRQVAWFEVHLLVAPWLATVDSWPVAGTPAWCALDDHDPAKWAAVLDAAQHAVLHWDASQQARADASREISAAADWSAIARSIADREAFYAERPWLKRRPA
ncbi:DUF2742 domain-containing protein [Mycobacterium montefiorense]|uniref:DUF2742 domain-containing protein n=1 Tax=Mycobacterium montefiorense TaxID=154654 RepID=UPI0021DCD48D|nr:DUF2742 domain-containing protein [Mycobacterium montefiorense]MCV7428147.1 DUF2742 domain-containing protein [Mycobacterium montefiorense]GLE53732.1 hypothetical protein ATCCBAA256_32950 [Mycobacterium montefiorense]